MDLTAVEDRLAALRREYAAGGRALDELAARRDDLTATMLRISGAIQVLEELLAPDGPPGTRAADGIGAQRHGDGVGTGPWRGVG